MSARGFSAASIFVSAPRGAVARIDVPGKYRVARLASAAVGSGFGGQARNESKLREMREATSTRSVARSLSGKSEAKLGIHTEISIKCRSQVISPFWLSRKPYLCPAIFSSRILVRIIVRLTQHREIINGQFTIDDSFSTHGA